MVSSTAAKGAQKVAAKAEGVIIAGAHEAAQHAHQAQEAAAQAAGGILRCFGAACNIYWLKLSCLGYYAQVHDSIILLAVAFLASVMAIHLLFCNQTNLFCTRAHPANSALGEPEAEDKALQQFEYEQSHNTRLPKWRLGTSRLVPPVISIPSSMLATYAFVSENMGAVRSARAFDCNCLEPTQTASLFLTVCIGQFPAKYDPKEEDNSNETAKLDRILSVKNSTLKQVNYENQNAFMY